MTDFIACCAKQRSRLFIYFPVKRKVYILLLMLHTKSHRKVLRSHGIPQRIKLPEAISCTMPYGNNERSFFLLFKMVLALKTNFSSQTLYFLSKRGHNGNQGIRSDMRLCIV